MDGFVLPAPLFVCHGQHVLEREDTLRVLALSGVLGHERGAEMRGQLEQKLDFLYEKLGAVDTEGLVNRWVVDPPRIQKPQPEALKAATV